MPTNRLSRRQFLASSTAAAAVPLFIPTGVLAAPGRPGANDRIGVAGIGIGRQGSSDLKDLMKDPRSRFIAIADVNLPAPKRSPNSTVASPTRTTASCWSARTSMRSSRPRSITGGRSSPSTPARPASTSMLKSR